MNLFEQIHSTCNYEQFDVQRLIEKKDHLIDKNDNLDPLEKQIVKDFFNKNPSYESKINWNKNKELTFQDFEEVMNSKETSKSQLKKQASEGNKGALFVGKEDDLEIIHKSGNNTYVFVKTYKGAVFADSFNCGGQGAKWCIGWEQSSDHWDRYTRGGSTFVLVMFSEPVNDNKKVMLQLSVKKNHETGAIVVANQTCWIPSDHTTQMKKYVPSSDIEKIKDIIAEKHPEKVRKLNVRKQRFDGQLPPMDDAIEMLLDAFNEQIENNNVVLYNIKSKKVMSKAIKSLFIIKLRPTANQIYVKPNTTCVVKVGDYSFIDELTEKGFNYIREEESETIENRLSGNRNYNETFINEEIDLIKLGFNKKFNDPLVLNDATFVNCKIKKIQLIYETSEGRERTVMMLNCEVDNIDASSIKTKPKKKVLIIGKYGTNIEIPQHPFVEVRNFIQQHDAGYFKEESELRPVTDKQLKDCIEFFRTAAEWLKHEHKKTFINKWIKSDYAELDNHYYLYEQHYNAQGDLFCYPKQFYDLNFLRLKIYASRFNDLTPKEKKILYPNLKLKEQMFNEIYNKSLKEGLFKKESKSWRDKRMENWRESDIHDFVTEVMDWDDPNKSRSYSRDEWGLNPKFYACASICYNSLHPSGVIHLLKFSEYDKDIIDEVVKKAFIGWSQSQTDALLKFRKARE